MWDKRIVPTAETQAVLFYEVTAGRLAVAVNKQRSLCPSPHSQSSHLSTPPPSAPNSSLPTFSVPRRLADCSYGIRSSWAIVCVLHHVCALPASHSELMCICSYSQANPPPIIVNADSLDAGPYVSICSRCLYSIYPSCSHFLWCMNMFVCFFVCVCMCVCVCVCVDGKASSW